MRDQLVLGRALQRREAEQAGMVAEAARDVGLAQGLLGPAHQARDHDQRPPGLARDLGRRRQHRLVKPGLADRELGGMHADGEPGGTGIDVVAAERPLAPKIERAPRISASGCAGITRSLAQRAEHALRQLKPMQPHRSPSLRRSVVASTGPVNQSGRCRSHSCTAHGADHTQLSPSTNSARLVLLRLRDTSAMNAASLLLGC